MIGRACIRIRGEKIAILGGHLRCRRLDGHWDITTAWEILRVTDTAAHEGSEYVQLMDMAR